MIRFRCSCGKKLKADVSIVGKKVKCSECSKINTVPPESTAEPSNKNSLQKAQQPPQPTIPSKPTTAVETTPKTSAAPLLGDDSANSFDVSLLPSDDDSSSTRFKLAPEFDPEPAEQTVIPASNFEFDLDEIEFTDRRPNRKKPPAEKATSKPPSKADSSLEIDTGFEPKFRLKQDTSASRRTLLYFAAILGGLFLIIGVGYVAMLLFSSGQRYSQDFEAFPEVKQYRSALMNYEKSRRMLRVMGEAYVKAEERSEDELSSLESFLESTSPSSDQTLDQAYELFNLDQKQKAKEVLRTAIATLNQRRPEIEAKAVEYQSKTR